ncbi:MAG: L,D-transpeptidase family protein [Planctomycetota bacterium]
MARRRRRRSSRLYTLSALVILAGGAVTYYKVFWKPIRDATARTTATGDHAAPPRLISDRPEDGDLTGGPYRHVPEHGAATTAEPSPPAAQEDFTRALALMNAGLASLNRGEVIDARAKLSEALALQLPQEDRVKTRAALSKLADQTLFSPAVTPNDPFASTYVVKTGDSLVKIAKEYAVTAELLARVNNLADRNMIRIGQRLKVLHGPFHAVIDLKGYDMDVFLQNTFVKHFKVGLGESNSTPTGKWRVQNKLINPTYYPPRGGDIIAADDPKNPLGERWIGLHGLEGEAVGQERYGIHGTIEPESIGKNLSLGCVRLYNEDVELLFDLLVEEKSTVLVR